MRDRIELDPRIKADSFPVMQLALCGVRLQNDARFPWLVLVPAVTGAVEFTDLSARDRAIVTEEIAICSVALKACATCRKINIGALGNIVPQLHIHVVGRRPEDAAWPGPVWGAGEAAPYEPDARDTLIQKLRGVLSD